MRSSYSPAPPPLPAYTTFRPHTRTYAGDGAAANGQAAATAAAPPHSHSAAAAAAAYAHPSLLSRGAGGAGQRDAAASPAASSSASPARPAFHVGLRVDARDAPGKWLPAHIVEIDDRGPMARWQTDRSAAAGRSPLLPPKSSASLWELDQTGSWQPRGGRSLLIHFAGFSDKWDEHIHEACWVHDTHTSASAATEEAMRPRLAPLGMLTRPSQHARSLSNSGRSRPRPYVIGEKVSVLVHRPTDGDSSFLSTLGLGSASAAAAAAPRFTASWFQAIVIDVDGDQVQIKYSPRQTNDNSFTFPVWFHVKLGEVKRFGASDSPDDDAAIASAALSPASAASTPLSPSAVAAANRASAAGVANGSVRSDAPATPESDSLLSSFKSMFTRSPTAAAAPPSAPHTPIAAASPAARSAAAAPTATPVHAPVRATGLPSTPAAGSAPSAASTAAAMSPSPVATVRANIARAAAVPPVTPTPVVSSLPVRNNLAAASSAAASSSSAAASSSPAIAATPPPSTSLTLRSSVESPYAALLRASAKAPLRAPVGIINLGNSCYISAGLQCLAGLRPLIQYFLVDRSHLKVLEQRVAAARASQRANLAASAYSPSKVATPPALLPRFGELTKEFANIMHRLHTGVESRIYTDQLKSHVQHLPNEAGSRFRGAHMQDAHEFLAVLLNALHEELNMAPPMPPAAVKKQLGGEESKSLDPPPAVSPFDPAAAARLHWSEFESRNTDVFSHLFYGQSAQYVICSTCRTASCNHHVMGQLTLDIPHTPAPRSTAYSRLAPPPSSYAAVTLSQCLSTALVADKLDDYSCSACKSKQPAITSVYFTALPPILLIQLKRFDMAATLGGFSARTHKDDTPCVYPLELDASPLLQPHPSVLKSLRVPPYILSPGAGGVRYRLVGVVRHHDDHYTAFCHVRDARAGGAEAWGYFNDSRTFIEVEEDVLAHEQTVYLLMYQRI